jgi:nucleoid DNA-binding protein
MATKVSDTSKPRNKSAVYNEIADATGLARKQVAGVFEAMSLLIKKDLGKKGPGVFVVPGLMKVTVVRKPATKGGMRPNPFKPGEMMEVKPRPARNVVKVRPLKALKEMV